MCVCVLAINARTSASVLPCPQPARTASAYAAKPWLGTYPPPQGEAHTAQAGSATHSRESAQSPHRLWPQGSTTGASPAGAERKWVPQPGQHTGSGGAGMRSRLCSFDLCQPLLVGRPHPFSSPSAASRVCCSLGLYCYICLKFPWGPRTLAPALPLHSRTWS